MNIGLVLAQRGRALSLPPGVLYHADFVGRTYVREGVHVPFAQACGFSRGSAAWAPLAGDRWQEVAIDEPRLTAQGLLLEPEQVYHPVNSLLAGVTPGDVLAGSFPGCESVSAGFNAGLTFAVLGTGTRDDGLPYIRLRLSGTAVGTQFLKWLGGDMVAVRNDTVSARAYLRIVSGAGTVAALGIQVAERNPGTVGSHSVLADPGRSGWQTLAVSRTLSSATASAGRLRVFCDFADGAEVDLVFDLCGWQLTRTNGLPSLVLTDHVSARRRLQDRLELMLFAGRSSIITISERNAETEVETAGNHLLSADRLQNLLFIAAR